MLISHEFKFIFIHIPKTAGVSITNALQPFSDQALSKRITRHASFYEIRRLILPEQFNHYIKFCFVRNPWDWFVSLYAYIRSPSTGHADRQILKNSKTFHGFVEWVFSDGIHRSNPVLGWWCREDGKKSKDQKRMSKRIKPVYKPQYKYMIDKNEDVKVDYIGRFESLTDSFQELCSQLGLSKIELTYENQSKHKEYRSYYDDKSCNQIATMYAEDIERFGYKF